MVGEIESESKKYDVYEMLPLKDCNDIRIVYSIEEEALVIRKPFFTLDDTSKTRYVI